VHLSCAILARVAGVLAAVVGNFRAPGGGVHHPPPWRGDQLHGLAYNLANFLRTLALPREIAQWSLTSLREKVVKIGAKVVSHGRYLVFQMAEVAVPRELFDRILERIARLRPPDPAPC